MIETVLITGRAWLAAISNRIIYRASSLLALRCAADQGLGVAALPCFVGDADPLLGRLGDPLPELAVSLWLITHPDLRRVARIRVVLDGLATGLIARRPLLEGAAGGQAGSPAGQARSGVAQLHSTARADRRLPAR